MMDIRKLIAFTMALGVVLPVANVVGGAYNSSITASADEINYIDEKIYNQNVKVMVYLLNQYRETQGLQPLKTCDTMNSLAQKRALEQLETGMSHTRPNGASFSTIFSDNGVSRSSSAENLYKTTASINPSSALNYWKNSEGHNANMLGDYEYVGVSVILIDGYYYWLQLFCNSNDSQITENAYLITDDDIIPVTTTTTTITEPIEETTTTVTTTYFIEDPYGTDNSHYPSTTKSTVTEPVIQPTTIEETTTTEPDIETTVNNFVNGVYGDMDGDGKVNVIDLLILKKVILGLL